MIDYYRVEYTEILFSIYINLSVVFRQTLAVIKARYKMFNYIIRSFNTTVVHYSHCNLMYALIQLLHVSYKTKIHLQHDLIIGYNMKN